jgi:hypothetical protein
MRRTVLVRLLASLLLPTVAAAGGTRLPPVPAVRVLPAGPRAATFDADVGPSPAPCTEARCRLVVSDTLPLRPAGKR